MNPPTVSIVVPAHQAQDHIAACIESLLAQDYPATRLEILVVDNRSTDATAEIVRRHPVEYIHESRRGVPFARNAGLDRATGQLIAFTDADCLAEKDWISRLVPHFDDPQVGGVGGTLAPHPTDNLAARYIEHREILVQEKMFRDETCSPPFFITANVMYRTAHLREIGRFDETLIHAGEDADLAWRVAATGQRLVLEPAAIVYHKHRSSIRGLFKQLFKYGAGSAALFRKHRQTFGRRTWIHLEPHKKVVIFSLLAPFALLFNRDKFKRWLPFLDAVNNLGFVLGKLYGSLKYRVLVI